MSELFASLYLDEDVSILVAALLRSRGFSVLTTHEAKQAGKSDTEQLTFASARRLVILTHNRSDFESLAADSYARSEPHGGIIIAVRRTPHQLAQRLLRLLNEMTVDEMHDQVFYI